MSWLTSMAFWGIMAVLAIVGLMTVLEIATDVILRWWAVKHSE